MSQIHRDSACYMALHPRGGSISVATTYMAAWLVVNRSVIIPWGRTTGYEERFVEIDTDGLFRYKPDNLGSAHAMRKFIVSVWKASLLRKCELKLTEYRNGIAKSRPS
jgi:hypothetical protein